MLSSLIGAKLGATIAGVAVGLGGAATVAYTVAVAPAQQNQVHPAVPAATSPTTPATSEPVGPDAKGPAAFGLCTAWTHHQGKAADDGESMDSDSTAMQNLAKAAGGKAKIAAYCATVPHPGNGKAKSGSKATGKPTSHPGKSGDHATGKSGDHATGKPTTHATGKPTTHPTGVPTTLPTPTRVPTSATTTGG